MTLDDLLDEWTVFESGITEGPSDWHAVANNDGIVAYFGNISDAYRFRLNEINRILNG